MKKTELKELLTLAISRALETENLLCNSDNLQSIDVKKRAFIERCAYQTVLDYINDNPVFLKMAAGK